MKTSNPITPEMIQEDMRYLQLLSRSFPTIAAASSEIINLEAIVNLPKGTEHFLADLHGEYEAFQHVLRNASGAIKRKVKEVFGDTLSDNERKELCTLIYYPEQKLHLVKASQKDLDSWYLTTLNRLVAVCQTYHPSTLVPKYVNHCPKNSPTSFRNCCTRVPFCPTSKHTLVSSSTPSSVHAGQTISLSLSVTLSND